MDAANAAKSVANVLYETFGSRDQDFIDQYDQFCAELESYSEGLDASVDSSQYWLAHELAEDWGWFRRTLLNVYREKRQDEFHYLDRLMQQLTVIASAIDGDTPEGGKYRSRWISVDSQDASVNARVAELANLMSQLMAMLAGINEPIERENAALALRSQCAACIAQIDNRFVDANLLRQTQIGSRELVDDVETAESNLTPNAIEMVTKVSRMLSELLKLIGF